MQETKTTDYNPDTGGKFWVTTGLFFVALWFCFFGWFGLWGAGLGWLVAAPAAVVLTIIYWIAVDVVRHVIKKRIAR